MAAPPGRPRDPQLDDAAMDAAVRLIVEGGYHALSMDRIAARAVVSKAALYRRWPNKLELTIDAIAQLADAKLAPPDTGATGSDLLEVLLGFVRHKQAEVRTFEALHAAVVGEPELAQRCRDLIGGRFVAMFRAIVARGVERGELPSDTDVDLLGDVVPALIRLRRERTGRSLDRDYAERIVAQFFSSRRRGEPSPSATPS